MKFVCFSFLAPPASDAESACAGRFLSALAASGHEVHLVTLDHAMGPKPLSPDVSGELLDGRIQVTRIPLRKVPRWEHLLTKFKYGISRNFYTAYIAEGVRILRMVLKANPGAILLSRAEFPESHLVAFQCRKCARAWVAHFSDPFPIYKRIPWQRRWQYLGAYFWCRRILRHADLITVTCRNAVRYFDELTHGQYSGKFCVVNHIGSPRLSTCGYQIRRDGKEKIVVHVGTMFAARGAAKIVAAARRVPGVRFMQYGPIDDQFKGQIECRRIESPRMATDAMANADAMIIADLDSGFGYSPYLPSKFAYGCVLGVPIIAISEPESEMAYLAKEMHGVFFVDRNDSQALVSAFEKLAAGKLCPPTAKDVERFTSETVARCFEETIKRKVVCE